MSTPNQKPGNSAADPFVAFYDLAMADEAALDLDQTADGTPSPEAPGLVIAGRYVLISILGEGGTGQVWEAEQTHPVRREVALKIIRPGLLAKPVSARFNREHQVLARMEHPNIAAVFDAGELPDGRTYFVMEMVTGAAITRWCKKRDLRVREKLSIFLQACMAVHHAHQKNILHRDLKPSNVMVTEVDGKPIVKVIDFGIAKTLAGDLSLGPEVTLRGMVLGTPRYMSPEQAGLTGQNVDARTDVYSLGILLYELLTGTTPITDDATLDQPLPELLQRVRQTETELPSRRLTRELTMMSNTMSRAKFTARELRGDVDWIVLRCLQKERGLRYPSALALAEDIQRFLDNEPVSAGPPSLTYKTKKWFIRQRPVLTTVAAVIVTLAGGLAATWWALAGQEVQRLDAQRFKQAAINESDLAQRVSAQLEDLMSNARKHVDAGMNTQLLRNLADECASGMSRFASQPKAEARLADQLAQLYSALDEPGRALPWVRRRWELLKETDGPDSRPALDTLYELGWRSIENSEPAQAAVLLREAVAGFEKLPDAQSDPGLHLRILQARHELARALSRSGRHDEAIPLMADVIKDLGDSDPATTALWLRAQSDVFRAANRKDEAIAALNQALKILPQDPQQASLRASLLGALAANSAVRDRYDEALQASSERVRILDETLPPGHPKLLGALISHARLACRIPGCPGGEDAARRALAIARSAGHESRLADAWIILSETLRVQRQFRESEQAIRDGIAEVSRTRAEPWRLLELHRRLGDILTSRSDFAAALAEYDSAAADWFSQPAPGRAPEETGLIFGSLIKFWELASETQEPLPDASAHLAEWRQKFQDWKLARSTVNPSQ